MEHFFTYVDIENFKSIKKLRIDGCKRINLFIGPPNVGKSNIIEALSLFSLPEIIKQPDRNLNSLIRLDNLYELFYEGEGQMSSIKTDRYSCTINDLLKFNQTFVIRIDDAEKTKSLITNILKKESDDWSFSINNNLRIISNHLKYKETKIKRYHFNYSESYSNSYDYFDSLLVPNGLNIYSVIQHNKILKASVDSLFSLYGLKLLFDTSNRTLKVFKEIKNNIFSMPFKSIADTLQRMIFFKTAILSNQNSILLFEEPEAHCYPPYIAELSQEIIEAETNQFFIATHSPVIINEFLDDAFDETAIYMVGYEDNQTIVNQLSEDQKMKVLTQGVDLFFNSEYFDFKK